MQTTTASPASPAIALPAVKVAALDHFFGQGHLRKQALFDINLAIQPGEIIIMTGPSGSGKTTLLSLIGGLRSAQQGNLTVLGQKLCGAGPKQLLEARRRIGYIFQAHNLLESLTAMQNVRMSLQLHSRLPQAEEEEKAATMLEAVGLGQRLHYYPDDLSGGQKQRVAIARALVCRPQIVLADEPTAALDSKSGRDVVTLMQQMAQDYRCTILMVTHDNRILDIANRIVHMEDGQLCSITER